MTTNRSVVFDCKVLNLVLNKSIEDFKACLGKISFTLKNDSFLPIHSPEWSSVASHSKEAHTQEG